MNTSTKGYSNLDTNTIKGGIHNAETYSDIFRDNPSTLWKDGMLYYVSKEKIYYQYDRSSNKWSPCDIKNVGGSLLDFTIDGTSYKVINNGNYDFLLQQLIQTKYSLEEQTNLNNDMTSYSPIYYKKEQEFLNYVIKCKKVAYKSIYGVDYPMDELDECNQLTFPILSESINSIKNSIEKLNIQVQQQNQKYVSFTPSEVNIGYMILDEYSITFKVNGINQTITSNSFALNSKTIYSSDTLIDDFTYTIIRPKVGTYQFIYSVTFDGTFISHTETININFVNPVYCGISDNDSIENIEGLTSFIDKPDTLPYVSETDGNYLWICIPDNMLLIPVVECDNMQFPMIYANTLICQYCDYKCYRSTGKKGFEKGNYDFRISYD